MSEKSLAEMQREVDLYISQFKEGYFSPLSMLARMRRRLVSLPGRSTINSERSLRKRMKRITPSKWNWVTSYLLSYALQIHLEST